MNTTTTTTMTTTTTTIFNVCCKSSVVNKPVHMRNDIRTTINIRSTSEG